MRTSTTLVGVLFGALLAGALLIPLFVGLPSRYLNNWYYVHEQAGLFAVVGALVVWCGAGFAGAATHPEDCVRSGTTAGGVASLVGSVLIVLPAAAAEACGDLVAQMLGSPFGVRPDRLAGGLALAAVRAMWLPSTAALGMMLAGPALGAVGGVLFDLWRGLPTRQGREVHRSSVPVVGLVMVAISVGGFLWLLRQMELVYLPALGQTLALGARTQLTAPLALAGVLSAGFGWWVIRDAAAMYRGGVRMVGMLWLMMGLGLLPVIAALGVAIYPAVYTTLAAWLSIFATIIVLLFALVAGARSDDELQRSTRTAWDLVGQGVLHGVVVTAVPAMIGGSGALALALFAQPYADAIVSGSTQVTAYPSASALLLLMQGHWAMLGLIALITVVYLVPALPALWAGRVLSRRD